MTDEGDDAWSSSSAYTPSFRFRWDVFLSFRGEDTRHNFTERLYNELVRNGIRTFRDDEELEQGDEIAPSLLTAIEESAASIAIISKNYASSKWCLEELAKIIECRRLILPVFYQVDPSHVRRQMGPFEEAFQNLQLRFGVENVGRWRKAMEKAGGISGWDSRIWEEPLLIQSLVKKVLTKLSNIPLGVAKFPVGLNSRLETLLRMLDVKANGVHIVGFYGMGGVGKTTLAKALYNKLVIHFKKRSFISHVRETSLQHNGLTSLQRKLIGDLSSSDLPSLNDVREGIISIKRVIHEEPVLLVLDDVDNKNQLNALAGEAKWFYEGSRIIITTRNRDILLGKIVNKFYEVKELTSPESLQLFSYHAFGREKPPQNFMKLSEQVVSLTGGLPLALEVFGSFLFDKRRIMEWEDALQKLKRIRPGHLQDVLEISFSVLDEEEKCIFLDIACFFVNMKMKREDAIDIFKGCGFNAEIAITVLTAKSLIKIIDDNVLSMHDQLRDMGRQIVQRQHHADPGMRSRLWDHDEIMTVLKNKKGTRSIEGITLDFEKQYDSSSERIYQKRPGLASAFAYLMELYKKFFGHGAENEKDVILSTKSFEPMVSLRLLQINRVKLDGNFKLLPAALKWLQWKECPLKTLPSEFSPQDLAVLDLSESKITKVWGWGWWDWHRNKMAEKLLVLNLRDCYYLTDIPDLSGIRLEKLILEKCFGLVKIHKSVGDMSTLTHLNLKGCRNLVEFPSDVSGLKRLVNLNLSGCLELKELPEDISGLKSLRELLLNETAIEKLPASIYHLKKLERFSLQDCGSLKQLPVFIGKLSSLTELSLDGSALKEMPNTVGDLTNLEKLNLRRCRSLTSIPDSIGNLKSLIELFLDNSSIQGLPDSIGSLSHLKNFSVGRCRCLTKLPDSMEGLSSLVWLGLQGTSITEVPDQVGALNTLEKLEMGYCESLGSLPKFTANMLNLTTLVLNDVIITELPESIGLLERLDVLKLNNCKYLRRLPASIGRLKCLRYLLMAETAVTELPEEFGKLSSLKRLQMAKTSHPGQPQEGQDSRGGSELIDSAAQENLRLIVLPTSFSNLLSLEELDACGWELSGKIPDGFEKLSLLEILNLGHNNICSLPSSLRGLSILKKLLLPHCKELQFLPPLPSSLLRLNVANCTSLESIPDLSNLECLEDLELTNCKKVMDIPGLECLKSLRRLYTGGCNACLPAVKRRLAKVALKHLKYFSLPGNKIPDFFYEEIPEFSSRKNLELKAVIIGVVVSLDQQQTDSYRDKVPAIVDIQAKITRLNQANIHYYTLLIGGS
ncbi:hypothetical protein F0562_033704 [Nyssa sinensis]|uniref:TIR domain-containing protein n=1 Tax=Nyssa sinensis TaxID=561372 RepID=A0A5J5AJ39_9ASTE|nr:hypothetical protein F0562_033704 [Nyssa sinensis]